VEGVDMQKFSFIPFETNTAPALPWPVLKMRLNVDQFTQEFLAWLPKNLHIWDEFVAQAIAVRTLGRDHYSAYTILEYIRHNSALTEKDGPYKINGHAGPYLARLFEICYPQHAGLFEFRETKKVKVENGQ
jgi:hypothetical protein